MATFLQVDLARLDELKRVIVRLAADLYGVPPSPAGDLGWEPLDGAARDFAQAWEARRRSTADSLMEGASDIAETCKAFRQADEAHRASFAVST